MNKNYDILDFYSLDAKISPEENTFSQVYSATEINSGRKVVIKKSFK